MSAPFVFSYKLVGDGTQGAAAAKQVRQEIEHLRDTAQKLATGSTLAFDTMLGIKEGKNGIAEYEGALARLRGEMVPLFGLEKQHEANLQMIAGAYRVGAITADEQAAAIARETAAHQRAVAALDGHTHAVNVNAAANGRAMAQRANLIFQLNDIFVSLASGQNLALVAIQQGSQISTIYGPGEGGMGAAFRETGKLAAGLALKFWPLALGVAGVALAVAGMRHEIEETSGVAVSFGDVFMAVFQVLGGYLYGAFRPQIEAIQGWFSWVWDRVIEGVKWVGNGIVSRFNVAFLLLDTSIKSIPAAFLVAGEGAANGFITGIEWLVVTAQEKLNGLFDGINGLLEKAGIEPIKLFDPSSFELPDIDIGGAAALEQLAGRWRDAQAIADDMATRDYLGEFFGDVQQQAIANYNAGLDETGKTAKRTAGDLKIADDAAKAFKETMDFGRDTFRSFVLEFKSGLAEGKNFWEALGNAGVGALDKIADRALGMMADGIFNMIIGAFMPGFGQTGGAWGNGLWGSAIFNAKGNVYNSPSLSAYSNQIVDRPTMFAFARGAGIMGEAGAEAIVPLTRTRSGDLGVRMVGGGAGMSYGGNTFAPVTNIYGSNMGEAELRRLLDERDRRLLEQVPATMYEAHRRALPEAA